MQTETPLCPSCTRPVSATATFCLFCGQPLGPNATTDPIQSIEAQGAMVRKAMEKPSAFIVAGIWLLFGLPMLFFVFMSFVFFFDPASDLISNIIGLSLNGFIIWLYWSIVSRVTQRYWAQKNSKELS